MKARLLAIVLVPLLISLCCLVALFEATKARDVAAKTYAKSIVILVVSQRLNTTIRDIPAVLYGFSGLTGIEIDHKLVGDVGELQKGVDDLRLVCLSDPSKASAFSSIEKTVSEAIEAIETANGGSLLNKINLQDMQEKKLHTTMRKYGDKLHDQLADLTQSERAMPELQEDHLAEKFTPVIALLLGVGLMQSFILLRVFRQKSKSLVVFAAIIPLVVELGTCSYIWYQSHERNPNTFGRGVIVVARAYSVSQMLSDAAIALGAYSLTKTDLFDERFDKLVHAIPDEVDAVSKLVQDNPLESEIMIDVRTQSDSILKKMKESKDTMGSGGTIDAKAVMRETRIQNYEVAAHIDELIEVEFKRAKASLETTKKQDQTFLVAGIMIAMNYLLQFVLLSGKDRSSTS